MLKNKIFFIQPGYAHYRKRLFELLSERHDIHFFFERSKNTYPGNITTGKLPCTFLDQEFSKWWIGLIYYLLKFKPKIVISSNPTSMNSFISFIYSKIFKKNFILWSLQWKNRPSFSNRILVDFWRFIRWTVSTNLIKMSDALVVGGSASKNLALSLGKNKNSIFVAFQCSNDISRGKSTIFFKTQNNKKNFTYLYLSRIIPLKGLDLLIKAFSKIEKLQEDVSLVIGGDGPFRSQCERLAKKLKTQNITFLGVVDRQNVGDIYEQADVFILPCYFKDNQYESWGLVVNEAMSMSLPVISTTAVGASFDLIIDGYNGFIVKEHNIKSLYNAMTKIKKLDTIKMGNNSRMLFESKNNYIKMADGFSSAIELFET